MIRHIDKIFAAPKQWGLRGDPYLWEELKSAVINKGSFTDTAEFKNFLIFNFVKLTGKGLDETNEPILIERYRRINGGMSSGFVLSETWKDKLFPLLEERYNKWA